MQPPIPDQVFTERNFESGFRIDIHNCAVSAQVETAYMTIDGVSRFGRDISGAVQRGVTFCIFVKEPDYWGQVDNPGLDPEHRKQLIKIQAAIEYAQSLGAHVNLRKRTHLKIAVFDYRVTWGGSLNLLSYTQRTDEESWRWTNVAWAHETVLRRRFADCAGCRMQPEDDSALILSSDIHRIGREIARRRTALGVTQQRLASEVGVSRDTVIDVELGKRHVRADVLVRIYQALDRIVVSVPPKAIPILKRWISQTQ